MLQVEIIGHIGNDAEVKNFNGQNYISFNVASSEVYKDAQGNKVSRTTWVSCLKYGESGVLPYLRKGAQVFVRGDLSTKVYNSQQGPQVSINCRVRELQLVGSKDAQGQGAQAAQAAPTTQAPAPARPSAPAAPAATAAPNGEGDLPF